MRHITGMRLFLLFACALPLTGQILTLGLSPKPSNEIIEKPNVILEWSAEEKCWECSQVYAVNCSGSGCNVPTITRAWVKEFKTPEEAVKWANSPFHPESFKVIGVYSLTPIKVSTKTTTHEIPQPSKTETAIEYSVDGGKSYPKEGNTSAALGLWGLSPGTGTLTISPNSGIQARWGVNGNPDKGRPIEIDSNVAKQ